MAGVTIDVNLNVESVRAMIEASSILGALQATMQMIRGVDSVLGVSLEPLTREAELLADQLQVEVQKRIGVDL